MYTLSFRYSIVYENGSARRLNEYSNLCLSVSDEEYLRIVKGIADGYSLMEIPDIGDILDRMIQQTMDDDRYYTTDGKRLSKPLKKPRKYKSASVFLENSEIARVKAMKDPVVEMSRPAQTMTVYRNDGSSIEICYHHGLVEYVDSRVPTTRHILTSEMFIKSLGN